MYCVYSFIRINTLWGDSMISESYKIKLEKEAKKLDTVYGTGNEFENIALDITTEISEQASLLFLKKIGEQQKKINSPKTANLSNESRELLFAFLGSRQIEKMINILKDESNFPLPVLLNNLDTLVGLKNVKQQVADLIAYNQIQQLRTKKGLAKSNKTLHMAFLGNPGTGKTTVARIVGHMYRAIGLLSKGQFIEASRTDLIAEYQGQTAIKVKRLINRAKGGVLFIDEAYSITENNHADSYGKESLTELTKALEDYRDDLVVIVAGYTDLMEQFFESNPGLKSRFNTFVSFEDYSVDELVSIFKHTCKENDYTFDEATIIKVRMWLQDKVDRKDDDFANGRVVRNLFDDVVMNQAKRLVRFSHRELDKDLLEKFLPEDVPDLVTVKSSQLKSSS
jgi:stage V sporulation protein K